MMRALFVVCAAVFFMLASLIAPASAQGPVGGALATLAAATVEAQQTQRAREDESARQRLTATALALDQIRAQQTRGAEEYAARQTVQAEQTALALDQIRAQQTRLAEEYATRRANNAIATRKAADATEASARETRQAIDWGATQTRIAATATSAAERTATRRAEVVEENRANSERVSAFVTIAVTVVAIGVIVVLLVIVAIRALRKPVIVQVVEQPEPAALESKTDTADLEIEYPFGAPVALQATPPVVCSDKLVEEIFEEIKKNAGE
jgi:hypothetical protein